MGPENVKAQMRKGILEYSILCVLADGDAYASDIIKRLKEVQMIIIEGTLYPLLSRQKNAGLLSYRWEESTQGPPRKYYSITEDGYQFLTECESSWDELVNSVNKLRKKNVI